jgi:hypothetical protein
MTDRSKNDPKLRSSCLLFELNLRKILLLMAVLAVLGSVISGCSPFYVIRAAYEGRSLAAGTHPRIPRKPVRGGRSGQAEAGLGGA